MRKCCKIPGAADSTHRHDQGTRNTSRTGGAGTPGSSSGLGRSSDPQKACPPLSRQQQSRRARSSTPTRLQQLTCKNNLPPEGHSPSSHINARVSCACEQCLLALHAAPQTRGIALQAAHQHDFNSVIPEGDEELATRCSSLASPSRSPAKSLVAAVDDCLSCRTPPIPEALAAIDSSASLSSAPTRTRTGSPVRRTAAPIPHDTSLGNAHTQKIVVRAALQEDSSPADTVLAWYTPFSSSSELCEMEHAENTAARNVRATLGDWKSAASIAMRACDHASHKLEALVAGRAARCASSSAESEAYKDLSRSPKRKSSSARSSSRQAGSSKLLLSRSSQCALLSTDLQRSVTCQTVPTPFCEASAHLPSNASGCTSAELASLCLPSVTLTTTVSQAQGAAVETSPGRLNSCPSLPVATWATVQAMAH